MPKDEKLAALLGRMHADGGWGYDAGGAEAISWTEPTAYALLALSTVGNAGVDDRMRKGASWLRGMQNADGGWRPQTGVRESTWVTAPVLLLPAALVGSGRERAYQWLREQTPANATFVYQLRQWMLGQENSENRGWSWFAGTAAWTMPTALTLLALGHENAAGRDSEATAARTRAGRAYLLDRACKEGGWNHGSSRALGYDLGAYPETTGLGLLALHGVDSPVVRKAVAQAQRQWPQCRSLEGQSWLRLGLMAQKLGDPAPAIPPGPPRTTVDLALSILADAAAGGHNVFLS